MLSDLNSEAIFYSHKFRQSLPDKTAMAIAAKLEMDKIKNYLIDIQDGNINDNNNIDKTIDKFISIVSDISVFSKNGFRTPVMRSEEYRSIVDATTIVSKTDKYGNITYVNNYFCRISGYTTDELLGKSHNIIRHPDMPKDVFKEMWETISREKKVWRGEILNLSKEKIPYWVDATIIPQLDIETKEIIGYAAFRYDITEKVRQRQLIEHEQQLNQMILDGWTGIVIIVDKNGGLIKANKAFFEAFKISSVKQFNSIHDSIFDLLGCRKIFEQNNEKELRHKTVFVDDNQKKVFMLTAKATYSDKSYVISMNDITEAENDIQTAKKESFAKSSFLANMIPQDGTSNRGIWSAIEGATRHIANKDGGVFVITGALYQGGNLKAIGRNNVLVPTQVYKVVFSPKQQKGAVYIVDNIPNDNYKIISIAELEKMSGINYFPKLDQTQKEKMLELPTPKKRG